MFAVGAKLDAALVPAVLAVDAARPQRSANLPWKTLRLLRGRRCGFSAKDAAAGRCFRSNRIYSKSSKVEKED